MSVKTELRPWLENVSESVIRSALNKGAYGADFIHVERTGHMISLSEGKPEKNITGYNKGIGLRTIADDGRQGVAYINSFGKRDMEDLVEWSWNNCRSSEPDPWVSLYEGDPPEPVDLGLYDPSVTKLTPEDRMGKCIEMTDAVCSNDPRVLSVRSASWADGEVGIFYASSYGYSGSYMSTYASCGAAVVLQDGENREMGGFGDESRNLSGIDHLKVAREAVTRTAMVLGGSTLETGKYDLVLDPEASVSFLEIIGDLFLASNVSKGKSLFKDKTGLKVGSSLLTIVDDGKRRAGMGTSPFDGEGHPASTTVLLDKGRVNSFLYNMKYAKMAGVSSTGNASRGISTLPDIDVTNLYMVPGDEGPSDMISRTKKGIYVLEFLGLHTVDPVSGDFSLGIKGAFIGGGKLAQPVSGITIAGNIVEVLDQIESVGNDLRFFGNTGGCTLVVKDVSAAGS